MSQMTRGIALAALALVVCEWRDFQTGRYIFKPIASIAFVAAALFGDGAGTTYGLLILSALVLSLIGDVFLIPKSTTAFKAGIVAFALAHIGFLAAFLYRGIDLRATILALVPLAFIGVLVARTLIPRVEQSLRAPVIGYSIILTLMLSAAIGTFSQQHSAALLAAAILFYLSDLCVAQDKFVCEAFINRLFGLPLYYGAQLIFAASIAAH